eukprot:4097867-Ditylum_brightwellii.AAC.1
MTCYQSIRFSGAGSTHQDGITERNIKTVCYTAQALRIHATIHSKEGTVSEDLWLMAMDHAAWCHTWGSPADILDQKLQNQELRFTN